MSDNNQDGILKIAIDARFLGSGTGIGRYVEQLILELEKVDQQNEYFILINKINKNKYHPAHSNFKKVIVNIPWYGLREQIEIPKVLKFLNVDLVHFPHFNVPFFYNQPFIVSIHDLILTKYPSLRASTLSPVKYFFKNIFYKLVIRHAICKSKTVITMAEFTKQEISKYFSCSVNKIKLIYEGITYLKQNGEAKDLKRYNIDKKFILYVGNAYPHKNLEFLIKAWSNFKENYQLVLVGRKDYFYQRLKRLVYSLNLENKIIFTGYLSDTDLSSFYQQAQAYVFPSLYEGFGLPPLEALRFKLPVLVSETSCLPEILKDAALYFDPQNQADFLAKLQQIIHNQKLRNKLLNNSKKLWSRYNWNKMAKKTLNIYNDFLY